MYAEADSSMPNSARARRSAAGASPASLDAEDVVEHRAHERVVEEPRRGPGAVAGVERGGADEEGDYGQPPDFPGIAARAAAAPTLSVPILLRPSSSPSSAPAARSAGSPPATRTTRPGVSTPPARSTPGPPPPSPGTPAPPSPIPRCPASLLPRAPTRLLGTCDRRPSRSTTSRRPVSLGTSFWNRERFATSTRATPGPRGSCAATRIGALLYTFVLRERPCSRLRRSSCPRPRTAPRRR